MIRSLLYLYRYWLEKTEVKPLHPNIRMDVINHTDAIKLWTGIGSVLKHLLSLWDRQ